jgi:hypothetical protein
MTLAHSDIAHAVVEWNNADFFRHKITLDMVREITERQLPFVFYQGKVRVDVTASVGIIDGPRWESARQHHDTQMQLYEMQMREYQRDLDRYKATNGRTRRPSSPTRPSGPNRAKFLNYSPRAWSETFDQDLVINGHVKAGNSPDVSAWRREGFAQSEELRVSDADRSADWPDDVDGKRVANTVEAGALAIRKRYSNKCVSDYEDARDVSAKAEWTNPVQPNRHGYGSAIEWVRYYQVVIRLNDRTFAVAARRTPKDAIDISGSGMTNWGRVLATVGSFAASFMALVLTVAVTSDPKYHQEYGGDYRVIAQPHQMFLAPSFYSGECAALTPGQVLECGGECVTVDNVAGRWVQVGGCWINFRQVKKQHGWWMTPIDKYGLLSRTDEEQAEVKERARELFLADVAAAKEQQSAALLARLAFDGRSENIRVDPALAALLSKEASEQTYRETVASIQNVADSSNGVRLAVAARSLPYPADKSELTRQINEVDTIWTATLIESAAVPGRASPTDAFGVFLETSAFLERSPRDGLPVTKLCGKVWPVVARRLTDMSRKDKAALSHLTDLLIRDGARSIALCPGVVDEISRMRKRAGVDAPAHPTPSAADPDAATRTKGGASPVTSQSAAVPAQSASEARP